MRVSIRAAAAGGWAAVVANSRPFALIQACAFALVALYYGVPAFAQAAGAAARVKVEGGFPLSGLATAFAGFVLPEAAKRLTRTATPLSGRDVLFQLVFFASVGITVDAFYRALGSLFGSQVGPALVIEKVLFDQLVFSVFVTIPYSTLMFLWRDRDFSFARLRDALRDGAFFPRYVPTLFTCWGYWTPVLAAVYALPPNLQFVLFLFGQAAWSLLLISVSK